MPPDVRPFPWQSLTRVNARDGHLAARLTSLGGLSGRQRALVPGIGELRLTPGTPERPDGAQLASRLSDPTSSVVVIRASGQHAYLVVPGRLVRSIGQRLLGGPDEIHAPRASTPAERGAVVYAIAAVLDAIAPAAQVEPSDSSGPLLASGRVGDVVLDVEIEGAAQGLATLVIPPGAAVARRPRRLAELVAARGPWLDGARLEGIAVLATTWLEPGDLDGLRVRDVLVADRVGPPDLVHIRVARGRVPARVAPDADGLIVIGNYERGPHVQEILGDDATVEVSVAAGSVTLPVRDLLELAPGRVLPLNRPLGSSVELRVGTRLVGRGELVDVDGELGVRIVALDEPLVRPS